MIFCNILCYMYTQVIEFDKYLVNFSKEFMNKD